jgi:hypothetical protein
MIEYDHGQGDDELMAAKLRLQLARKSESVPRPKTGLAANPLFAMLRRTTPEPRTESDLDESDNDDASQSSSLIKLQGVTNLAHSVLSDDEDDYCKYKLN